MEKLRNLRRKYFSPEMSMKALFAFCLIYAIVAGVALFKISTTAHASELAEAEAEFHRFMDKGLEQSMELVEGVEKELRQYQERQRAAGIPTSSCSSMAIIDTVYDMNMDGYIPTDPAWNLINQVNNEECVPCSSDEAEAAIKDTLSKMVAYGHVPFHGSLFIMDRALESCGLDGIFE